MILPEATILLMKDLKYDKPSESLLPLLSTREKKLVKPLHDLGIYAPRLLNRHIKRAGNEQYSAQKLKWKYSVKDVVPNFAWGEALEVAQCQVRGSLTRNTKTELKIFVMVSQVILFLLPEVCRKFSVMHTRIWTVRDTQGRSERTAYA